MTRISLTDLRRTQERNACSRSSALPTAIRFWIWLIPGRQDPGLATNGRRIVARPRQRHLFVDAQGSLLAVSPLGVFRMQGDPEAKPKTAEILGFKIPLKDNGGRFVEASPLVAALYTPLSAAQNLSQQRIAAVRWPKTASSSSDGQRDVLSGAQGARLRTATNGPRGLFGRHAPFRLRERRDSHF